MMFKLEQIGETHTDETTNFKVVLDKPYTVSSSKKHVRLGIYRY